MMICPPAGGAATVFTGGAKKSDELGAITGTAGAIGGVAIAGGWITVAGGATFTVTGAVVLITTCGGVTETNPGANTGNAGASGGRTIVVVGIGVDSAEVMKTGAAGTLRTGVPGTFDTANARDAGVATGVTGWNGTTTPTPPRPPPACAAPPHRLSPMIRTAVPTDIALMFVTA